MRHTLRSASKLTLHFFLATIFLCTAARAQQPRQILRNHVRPVVSGGQATPVGFLPPTQQLSLAVTLPLRNQSELTALLASINDASSPEYRHFLSVSDFTEQFGPTQQDYQSVVSFAKANGFTVTGTPANRLLVDITGSVAQIEKAFNVKMTLYQHPTEHRTFYSPDREPSLALSTPVAHIAGLNNYSLPQPMVTKASAGHSTRSAIGSGPGGSYLGSDMRAAYYGGTALTGSGQAVGLLEFGGYNPSDVNLTFSNAGQSYSVPINNVLLDGATLAPNGDDAEEVLDIVQAISMAPGLSQVRVYIAPPVNDVDVFNQMATDNLAKQLSCSWLWVPEDPSSDDPIFQEFAAQGQNLFVASGDYGGYTNFISFAYYYPAEDAFVTATGGTTLTTNGAGGSWESEIAWNGTTEDSSYDASGGGISPDGIAIPKWQAGIANSLNAASTNVRNVPDVAAEADTDNYVCDLGSCDGGWGGTSFAAPRWAGFLALINEQVASAGQPSLGFINPALYAIGLTSGYNNDLHDITSGNNDVTAGVLGGFNAAPGYDLVTGWGSPNGQNLINALPSAIFALTTTPNDLTVIQGGVPGTSTVALSTANGFSGPVTLAASGLPSGVSASFNPSTISGSQTSTLSLTASNSVTIGNSTATVTGTSGSLVATAAIALSIDFAMSISPATQTVTAHKGVSYTTTITMKSGFTGTVNLSVTGLPTGATAKFNPPSLSASGTSTLAISTTGATPAGTYALAVAATSGTLTQTVNVPLIVNATSENFTVTASPTSVTIGQTAANSSNVSILTIASQNNFSSPVTLTAAGLPPGVTAFFSPNPATPAPDGSITSILTLSEITWPAPYGTFPLMVTGTSGYEVTTADVSLTVDPLPFDLEAGDAQVILNPGTPGSFTAYISGPANFNSPVTLSVTGLPTGVTASIIPNPVIPVVGYGMATVNLIPASTAPAGNFSINLNATSGSFTESLNGLALTVSPAAFTVQAPASLTLPQNGTTSGTVTVTSQNGFEGSVGISVLGLPDGVVATFKPSNSINLKPNQTVNLTLKVAAGKAASTGTFPIVLNSGSWNATSSLLMYNTNMTVTVTGAADSTFVTLSSAFNLSGIELDGFEFGDYTRGIDNRGHVYSSNLLSGWSQVWNGIPFSLFTGLDQLNVVNTTGQTIPLPAGNFSSLRMLGTAVNGQQLSQPVTVTYTDGTATTFTQSLSDWQKSQSFTGESKALTMPYADNIYNGGRIPQPTYLYGYSFALDNTKTVESVTLPNNPNVDALAFTLVP
jgi:subtilase family serine protease